jgi:hypothetical protein
MSDTGEIGLILFKCEKRRDVLVPDEQDEVPAFLRRTDQEPPAICDGLEIATTGFQEG